MFLGMQDFDFIQI